MEQLEKTTIDLYVRDVEWLKGQYGAKWSDYIKELIKLHIDQLITIDEWKKL